MAGWRRDVKLHVEVGAWEFRGDKLAPKVDHAFDDLRKVAQESPYNLTTTGRCSGDVFEIPKLRQRRGH
jgi:hypothetical protein